MFEAQFSTIQGFAAIQFVIVYKIRLKIFEHYSFDVQPVMLSLCNFTFQFVKDPLASFLSSVSVDRLYCPPLCVKLIHQTEPLL